MLKVDNLTKNSVFQQVGFSLPAGEIGVIIGPSGAGKSTLLRMICGLEAWDSGSITLDDEPVGSAGLVFQQYHLFEHLTVERNVSLVLEQRLAKQEVADETQRLLELYGLADHAHKLARHLSGGQQQRLAIARAIAANPKVLCLDEPSSALDPALTEHIAKQLIDLAATGLVVLVTTHDMSLVKLLPCKLIEPFATRSA